MARRRRKKKNAADGDAPAAKATPAHLGTSLRDLLADALPKAEDVETKGDAPATASGAPKPAHQKPAPPPPNERLSDGLVGDDRIAFHDAFAGVRPLGPTSAAKRPKKGRGKPIAKGRRSPVVPREAPSDTEARARLAALVGGAVHFDVERDEDGVRGLRDGADPQILRDLSARGAFVEATLDLHGLRGRQAEQAVSRFVRAQHRKGVRRVCVVHGKGLHSDGVAVLRDAAVRALSDGGAAPVVLAFATAAPDRGGRGALLVALTRDR